MGDRQEKRKKYWLKQLKRKKKTQEDPDEAKPDEEMEHLLEDDQEPTTDIGKRKRYILFVGNLSYSTTSNDVLEYFAKRGVAVKEVRLLTRKGSDKSRGCCFLEFDRVKHQQNALKFDKSKLMGRTINIEVTCGGGGTGERRMSKIKERNEKLTISKNKKQ